MIDYVEIRDASRSFFGIVDTAKSVIWHTIYYGVGDFEIYAQATEAHKQLLQTGNYVTRPNDVNVGIIEAINVTFDTTCGYMLTATGSFAKSLLDRRLIYNLSGTVNRPTVLSGSVEKAARKLVQNNAISCSFDSRRNISILGLAPLRNLTPIIVDADGDAAEKQVSYQNLLEYSDELLQEYGLGARILLSDNKTLLYDVYEGADRSTDNTDGNEPVVFSPEYDNITSSEYSKDTRPLKNAALIGGAGEGLARFYSLIPGTGSGLTRREVWVDASSINRTYKDDQDQEQTYTDAEYRAMLIAQGRQELAQHVTLEDFEGEINVLNTQWTLGEDYNLGDIVTLQDNFLGIYTHARIAELTECQDESGYTVQPVFANY